MAIILTKNGVENTNIDGARSNYFNAGNKNGIVKGAFNEGRFFASSSNTITLDTCELIICGHRFLIDEQITHSITGTPSEETKYSFIAEVKVDDSSVVQFSTFIVKDSEPLIQDNLFANKTGAGTYQLKIGNFTHSTTSTIKDVTRLVKLITGGTNVDEEFYFNVGYDLVIRTQNQFDLFVNSLNKGTFSGSSVLLVGDGGNLVYTADKLFLPTSLKLIEGRDKPIIRFSCDNNETVISYDNDNNDDCYIKNIDIYANIGSSTYSGILFSKCKNIYNCNVQVFEFGSGNYITLFSECKNIKNVSITKDISANSNIIYSLGFVDCDNISNCKITLCNSHCFVRCTNIYNCYGQTVGTSTYVFNDCDNILNSSGLGRGSVFYNCNYITNCKAESKCETSLGIYADGSSAYNRCNYITNSYGKGTAIGDGFGYGFLMCSFLTNCIGTGIKGTGTGNGYGFGSVSHVSNCSGLSSEPSSSGLLGGSNTYVDSETVG